MPEQTVSANYIAADACNSWVELMSSKGDDSDVEDEFGQLIPPAGQPMSNPSLGASDPKKQQEAALGRNFGLENTNPKPKAPVVTK
ncbi:hypothetical protein ACMFMG_011975 [Clarireedia jacksonii]